MPNNTTLSAATLKRSLSVYPENDALKIRLHRSISWLSAAEKQTEDPDLYFISLWIAFNACYAHDGNTTTIKTERERLRNFTATLVECDDEKRIFNILWQKFSGAIRVLLENKFVFKGFWDHTRGEIQGWESAFERSNTDALKYLTANNVAGLLEILLDRLYVLRNQLIHGGSTYKSKLNRKSVKDGSQILEMLIPVIIDIMMQHPGKDWGKLAYPVV